MTTPRIAEKALALPLLLVAALLALAGCVPPPATVYPSQSAPGTINSQAYTTQPYTTQSTTVTTQPYTEAPQGYPSQQYQPQYQYQQQYQQQYFATFCSAGVYQCPVPGNTPPGTSCACPGLGAASYGVAR